MYTALLPVQHRYSAEQLECLLQDGTAFKALLREVVQGSPVCLVFGGSLCCVYVWVG